MRSRRRRGLSQETPASAAPPARNRRGRRPAAQSQARPTGRTPTPPRRLGAAAARSPHGGLASRPSLQPAPARPAAPAAAPPRAGPSGPGPGAPQTRRRLRIPPPANAALNSRGNNKQPDMSESAAAGPPSLAAKPQARPDREGNGRRQGQLVPGPARPTRTPGGHTHNTTCTAPSGGPGQGTHSSRGPGEDHSQHSWTRSQLARTHSHPLQTRSYTRIPGTLGIHWDPRSPPANTADPRHTYTSRTPRADTLVPDRSHAFTHVHGSHKHTSHTRPLLPTRAESTEHSSPHAEQKNTSHSRTHNKQHSRHRAHTNAKNATHQQRQLLPHNRTQMDTADIQSLLIYYTEADDTRRTPHAFMHTTFTPTYSWTHNTHSTFSCIPQTHSQAHHPLSTRSHIQHSRHTGSKLATSGHPTLHFLSRYATGAEARRGKLGPTDARLPAGVSVSGAQSWKVSARTKPGRGPWCAAACPGPGAGAPPRAEPSPRRARARSEAARRRAGLAPEIRSPGASKRGR